MEPRFLKIVEVTLDIEKEDSFDIAGGYTRWGFAQNYNKDIDVKTLTRDGAIERYYERYWKKPNISEIVSDDIAQKVFDSAVCMGIGRSIRILQKAINKTHYRIFSQTKFIPLTYGLSPLDEDGVLGSKTEYAVNSHGDHVLLLDRIKILTVKKRCDLAGNSTRYLKGWILRAIA